MSDRPTNAELCANFRKLLTDAARAGMDPATLEITKPWRAELWKAFREIEDRLDPVSAMTRKREELHKALRKENGED